MSQPENYFQLRKVPCGKHEAIVVELRGQPLASGTHQLNAELLETLDLLGTPRVILDLSDVNVCVSETVNALLRAREWVRSWNGDLRLCSATPSTQEVLATLGLTDRIFSLDDTVDEAVKALESQNELGS